MPELSGSRQCSCGSGNYPRAINDARGIFLCFACDTCERDKLGRFRPDVLTDPVYWHDEPIDDE
jgi:hypothetical protein